MRQRIKTKQNIFIQLLIVISNQHCLTSFACNTKELEGSEYNHWLNVISYKRGKMLIKYISFSPTQQKFGKIIITFLKIKSQPIEYKITFLSGLPQRDLWFKIKGNPEIIKRGFDTGFE